MGKPLAIFESKTQMPDKRYKIVIYSGYAVISAVVVILLSMAFLRGGHPPGYGIVNLIVIVLIYPASLYSSAVGLKTDPESVKEFVKQFYFMVGVSFLFALSATLLFVLKFVLGKSI